MIDVLARDDLVLDDDGKALELRFEALNAFNHPLFGAPPAGNLHPVSGSFGQVTSTAPYARRVQVHVRFIF